MLCSRVAVNGVFKKSRAVRRAIPLYCRSTMNSVAEKPVTGSPQLFFAMSRCISVLERATSVTHTLFSLTTKRCSGAKTPCLVADPHCFITKQRCFTTNTLCSVTPANCFVSKSKPLSRPETLCFLTNRHCVVAKQRFFVRKMLCGVTRKHAFATSTTFSGTGTPCVLPGTPMSKMEATVFGTDQPFSGTDTPFFEADKLHSITEKPLSASVCAGELVVQKRHHQPERRQSWPNNTSEFC